MQIAAAALLERLLREGRADASSVLNGRFLKRKREVGGMPPFRAIATAALPGCSLHVPASNICHCPATQESDPAAIAAALFAAVQCGLLDSVTSLLAKGADPNARDRFGSSPLFYAAKCKHLPVIHALLQAGARLTAEEADVHDAVSLHDLPLLEALLAAGAKHSGSSEFCTRQPLHLAASSGQESMVAALLAAGADVRALTAEQQTALHLAAQEGHNKCCIALLAAGAEPNAADGDGRSPLFYAAFGKHLEAMETLLHSGVRLTAGEAGSLELEHAVYVVVRSNDLPLLEALLAAGADVRAQTGEQQTALHLAAQKGHAECCAVLLAAGAEPSAADGDCRSPLFYAASGSHVAAMGVLLRGGAVLNTTAKDTNSLGHALWHAVKLDCMDLVKALHSAGARLESVWSGHATTVSYVLWDAVRNPEHATLQVVQCYRAAGAVLGHYEEQACTAAAQAVRAGQTDVLRRWLVAGVPATTALAAAGRQSLMHLAAATGQAAALRTMLEEGADCCVLLDQLGPTPLQTAAENGHLECVKASALCAMS